jgi:hypothetical protein
VIEVLDRGLEDALEELEIEEKTVGLQLFADQGDEDAVVMAVRVLALAVVVAKVVT